MTTAGKKIQNQTLITKYYKASVSRGAMRPTGTDTGPVTTENNVPVTESVNADDAVLGTPDTLIVQTTAEDATSVQIEDIIVAELTETIENLTMTMTETLEEA